MANTFISLGTRQDISASTKKSSSDIENMIRTSNSTTAAAINSADASIAQLIPPSMTWQAPSLYDQIAITRFGFQRPSRFAVAFEAFPVNWFTGAAREAARVAGQGLLCSNITTAAREFETTELPIFGYDETYPVGTEFTPITCTFLLPLLQRDGLYNATVSLFNQWQSRIQNVRNEGARTFRFPRSYRLENGFVVHTFDNRNLRGTADGSTLRLVTPDGVPLSTVTQSTQSAQVNPFALSVPITNSTRYYNVYPKTVQPSDLDWSATDEFLQLRVEFSFTHWEDVTGQ